MSHEKNRQTKSALATKLSTGVQWVENTKLSSQGALLRLLTYTELRPTSVAGLPVRAKSGSETPSKYLVKQKQKRF